MTARAWIWIFSLSLWERAGVRAATHPSSARAPSPQPSPARGRGRRAALLGALLACTFAAAHAFEIHDDAGQTTHFDAAPARIVSLLPSLTETVCALGACDRLVGVDRYSNWPAGAQAAAQSVPAAARGQRVYYEVDAAPHAAGRGTFIDELLTALGLVNIIDASLGPYPKINPELVVRADPDLIMISQQGAAQLARRPGWAQLRALRQGHVCAFNAEQRDILVRPGPRMPEAALLMADCAAHRMPAEK